MGRMPSSFEVFTLLGPSNTTETDGILGFLIGYRLFIHLKEFFESLGIVFEAPTNVNTLEHFIVFFVSCAKICWHFVGLVEISNGFGIMGFTSQQYVFGRSV